MDLVAAHAFSLDDVDELYARRFLRKHGDELARDLVDHKRADLHAKNVPAEEHEAVERLARLLEQERDQPHRLGDLAVDGGDLLDIGYSEGPALGRTLQTLLDDVVEDPKRNRRDYLLRRAKELLA
jgi:tRNA nucleotidyltransferase (CCA-adding enzyme)